MDGNFPDFTIVESFPSPQISSKGLNKKNSRSTIIIGIIFIIVIVIANIILYYFNVRNN